MFPQEFAPSNSRASRLAKTGLLIVEAAIATAIIGVFLSTNHASIPLNSPVAGIHQGEQLSSILALGSM
jgi:hypothetical protein